MMNESASPVSSVPELTEAERNILISISSFHDGVPKNAICERLARESGLGPSEEIVRLVGDLREQGYIKTIVREGIALLVVDQGRLGGITLQEDGNEDAAQYKVFNSPYAVNALLDLKSILESEQDEVYISLSVTNYKHFCHMLKIRAGQNRKTVFIYPSKKNGGKIGGYSVELDKWRAYFRDQPLAFRRNVEFRVATVNNICLYTSLISKAYCRLPITSRKSTGTKNAPMIQTGSDSSIYGIVYGAYDEVIRTSRLDHRIHPAGRMLEIIWRPDAAMFLAAMVALAMGSINPFSWGDPLCNLLTGSAIGAVITILGNYAVLWSRRKGMSFLS